MSVYGMVIDGQTNSYDDYLTHMETAEKELIQEIRVAQSK